MLQNKYDNEKVDVNISTVTDKFSKKKKNASASGGSSKSETILPDFLSDDYELANVLNEITNYETGQLNVQSSQNVNNATCHMNNFQIPGFQNPSGFAISSMNNCTVNFYFQK